MRFKNFLIIGVSTWMLFILSDTILGKSVFFHCSNVFTQECWFATSSLSWLLTLVSVIATVIYPFSWFFIIFQAILIFIFNKLLPRIKNIFKDKEVRVSALKFIFSVALLLQWATLLFSFRFVPFQDRTIDPIAQGGFPLKVLDYPDAYRYVNLDISLVNSTTLIRFGFNYLIWLVFSAVLYYFLPKKFTTNKNFLSILMVTALFFHFFSMGHLLLQFLD